MKPVWWHLDWTRCAACDLEVLSWYDEERGERVCAAHECCPAQEVAA